jgi:hypothetical protein
VGAGAGEPGDLLDRDAQVDMRETNEWRSSRGVQFSLIFAALQTARNSRRTLAASRAVPGASGEDEVLLAVPCADRATVSLLLFLVRATRRRPSGQGEGPARFLGFGVPVGSY